MTFQGLLKENESLIDYNSWRVGGVAERLYIPTDLQDLVCFLLKNATGPIHWLGLGSNVLIRDEGVLGTVIVTNPGLSKIEQLSSHVLRIEAGVPCAKVAKAALKFELVGAEFLIGIPGTVGGALVMNAGAFGAEIWPLVEAVETIDRAGSIFYRESKEFLCGYRHIQGLPVGESFVAVHLKLVPGNAIESLQKTKNLLRKRSEQQPIGLPSCGSVFRNPPGDHAARLIESCGLKGFCLGGAEISSKHANFIVHRGKGTASEIFALISLIEKEVFSRHGFWLEREVRILGE